MKKLALLGVVVLTGCAASKPLPENMYDSFAKSNAILNACHAANLYSPQDVARYNDAINYNLYTWASYDNKKLYELRDEYVKTFHPTASGIEGWCAQSVASFEGVVLSAENHKRQLQQQSVQTQSTTSSSSSFPSSVNCKQLGAYLNAEIKTFSGWVCPIGWVKA